MGAQTPSGKGSSSQIPRPNWKSYHQQGKKRHTNNKHQARRSTNAASRAPPMKPPTQPASNQTKKIISEQINIGFPMLTGPSLLNSGGPATCLKMVHANHTPIISREPESESESLRFRGVFAIPFFYSQLWPPQQLPSHLGIIQTLSCTHMAL